MRGNSSFDNRLNDIVMLSRRHIRVKVMQALYAYWNSGSEADKSKVKRDLEVNMYRLYDLYLYLLMFVQELSDYALRYDEEVKSKNLPSAFDRNVNKRFHHNPVIEKIRESKEFTELCKKSKLIWDTEDVDIIHKVFLDLKNSEVYQDYNKSDEVVDYEHLEILSHVIKHYPLSYSLLEQHFEEKFINWYDDSKIAIQMANKSFKRALTEVHESFLMPIATDEEVAHEYADKLFEETIAGTEEYDTYIIKRIDKWEPTRIPLLDNIILRMGIAEFIHFPSIPVKVTINEYVELAKNYSTTNSKKFINGVLDNVLNDLNGEDRVNKSGMGLIE